MNQVFSEMEMHFFHGETKEGLACAERVIQGLDFDDDDDLELLSDTMERGVFRAGCTGILDYLASNGFDFSTVWPGKGGLCAQCVQNRCYETAVFDRLVELGADPYLPDSRGFHVLHLVAARERQAWGNTLEPFGVYLIERYRLADLFTTDPFGATPLHQAVLNGHLEMARAMLGRGADVDATGCAPAGNFSHTVEFDGATPLHLACGLGNLEMARLLLEHGADDAVKNHKGMSAAHFAALEPNRLYCKAFYESIPAAQAVCDRKGEILRALSRIDLRDERGRTPLLLSLSGRRFGLGALAAVLLERGADPGASDQNGVTPLMYAAQNAHQEALKLLVAAGANLDQQNQSGDTALHLAVESCHTKQARYLIKKGARYQIVNNAGKSPADIAAQKGMTEVLELMIS